MISNSSFPWFLRRLHENSDRPSGTRLAMLRYLYAVTRCRSTIELPGFATPQPQPNTVFLNTSNLTRKSSEVGSNKGRRVWGGIIVIQSTPWRIITFGRRNSRPNTYIPMQADGNLQDRNLRTMAVAPSFLILSAYMQAGTKSPV